MHLPRLHRSALLPRLAIPTLLALLWQAEPSALRAMSLEGDGLAPRIERAPVPDTLAQADADEALYDMSKVRRLQLDIDSRNWQKTLDDASRRGRDTPARLTVDGRVLEQIGVRYKGNTSLSVDSIKKPLNLTLDAFVPGQRLWGFDIINLNNGWADPSMVREALAYELLRDYMPTPRVSFAELHVNGRFVGVYLMVEQIEKTFLDAWFSSPDGLLVKGDDPSDTQLNSSTLRWTSVIEHYERNYEVKGDDPDREDYRAVQDLARLLNAPVAAGGLSDAAFEAQVHDHLDVDAALWYLAANNLLANYDSYYAGHNYFIYRTAREPRWTMLNWDWNLSFGTFQAWFWRLIEFPDRQVPIHETDPYDQIQRQDRPLTQRLLSVPSFHADYSAHYRSLRDAVLDPEVLRPAGETMRELIRPAVYEEPNGLYSLEQFEDNFQSQVRLGFLDPGRQYAMIVPGVLDLAEARRDFLIDADRWPELVQPALRLVGEPDITPAKPEHTEAVEIRARFEGADAADSVELRYRVRRGAENRLPMRADETGLWQATIPAQDPGVSVRFAFRVGLDDGRAQFFPASNWIQPYRYRVAGVNLPKVEPEGLIINEILARNAQGLQDASGEREDWLELYNAGSATISLSGYFLSDDHDSPWDMPLPAVEIPAGGRYLVFCDAEPDEGPNHAPFRLSAEGETLLLSKQDAIYDQITFQALPSDRSYGRRLDAAADWSLCTRPSPGMANDCRYAGWPAFVPRLYKGD